MKHTSRFLLPVCAVAGLVMAVWASSGNPAQSEAPTFTPTSWYYFPLAARNWPWRAEKVIIVIWDGTQRAHLLEMLDSGQLLNLEGFIGEEGSLLFPEIDSETCEPGSGDGYRTETCPTNSAIATGLGYPGMANWTNADPHPIPDGLTLWEWFKERGYATGMVCAKDRLYWPRTPLSNAEPDIDYLRVGGTSAWATQQSITFVREYRSSPFFLSVHYAELDDVGHYYGENHIEYSNALVRLDGELATLMAELRAQGIDDETLVLLTTDHGFVEGGFGHSVCDSDTKGLFLAASPQMSWFSGCVEMQTDIAPCLKGLVWEHG